MENLDTQNSVTAEIHPQKKRSWMIVVLLGVVLIAASVAATYFYLSNNSELITSKKTSEGKMCEGVKIVFFPGGNEKDSFASVVYNGAKAAETDLGPNVEYVWSDWDSDKMVSQFKDSINKLPDAIAIMGHPGSEALSPLVDEAERKNILVTSQNVDLPDIREKYTSQGFGYVGQSLYNSGLTVGSAVIRKYQPKAGTEAIVFGVDPIKSPSRYERTKGCVDGLKKGNLVVHEVTFPLAVEGDPTSAAAEKMFSDAFAQYPNTKIIITDHGAVTAAAPLHFKNMGKKPGNIIIAGFDLSVDTVEGIKSGYIGLILDQQPYLQGYLPILQACLTEKYGFAGLFIDTGVGLIDNSNVDLVAELAKEKIR
jgi:simple sugar transport system substrate-binding protein